MLTRSALRTFLLLCLTLLTLLIPAVPTAVRAAPRQPASSRPPFAAPLQAAPIPVEPQVGEYSPNTLITRRGEQLWFIRPPYESRLLPVGDGTFRLTAGWLNNRLVCFTANEFGGVSIMLLSDDGNWNEFARSGELYPDLPPTLVKDLEQVLEEAISDPSMPGVALYVHVPGQGMWAGARGVSNRAMGIPMVPHDRFRIASVTKPFVATVMLQLADEGYLTLDDTVEQWMPRLVPNGKDVTIRHLLHHTSGLHEYLTDPLIETAMASPDYIWPHNKLVMEGVSKPPYFAPGAPGRWHYSNTNFVLLGMIVEHATGISLGQHIRWRILEPLGLRDTYFEPDEAVPGGVVRGYVGWADYTDVNMSFAWAAGNMTSTVGDLGTFADALFHGRLLSPAAMNTLLNWVDVQGARGRGYFYYGAGVMRDVMSVAPGLDGQDRPLEQGMVWGHTGGLNGYRLAMWYLPHSGMTLVVAHNQMFRDPNVIATSTMDVVLNYLDQTRQAAPGP